MCKWCNNKNGNSIEIPAEIVYIHFSWVLLGKAWTHFFYPNLLVK